MKKVFTQITVTALLAAMTLMAFTGCGGGTSKNSGSSASGTEGSKINTAESGAEIESKEPLLTYSLFVNEMNPPEAASLSGQKTGISLLEANPKDVVTPYIEKKFNIKLGDILYDQGLSWNERFNQLSASGTMADTMIIEGTGATTAIESELFAPLSKLIKENMPNYCKIVPEEYWKPVMKDGEVYSIAMPQILSLKPDAAESDPYVSYPSGFPLVTREDILTKLGYKFKPMSLILKECKEQNRKPVVADFALEPAIKTADDFYAFLEKVKALNLKVNNKDVIPFSFVWWLQAHSNNYLGYNYNFGWAWNPTKNNIDVALGEDPKGGGYQYYKFINNLYRNGMLDKDFLIQKDEQYQEKWASGQLACGFYVADPVAAQASLDKIDKSMVLRPIPRLINSFTLADQAMDEASPFYVQFFINKNFKDIPRLLKYFDYFYSDEGQDLLAWGPESSGLWEIKDGKKQLKDSMMFLALQTNAPADKLPAAYGLDNGSRAAKGIPVYYGYNPKAIIRSYPLMVEKDFFNKCAGANVNYTMYSPKKAYKGKTTLESGPDGWCWSNLFMTNVAKLITPKSDADYDKAYAEMHEKFMKESKFNEAREAVLPKLKQIGYIN